MMFALTVLALGFAGMGVFLMGYLVGASKGYDYGYHDCKSDYHINGESVYDINRD